MPWIHDNEIKSYDVDLDNNKIMFITQFENKDVVEKTKIIFENVTAHDFINIGSGSPNILFDIKVANIDEFLNEYDELIKERKNWGWPLYYKEDKELKQKLEEKKQKYYYIDAVCGMFGFVLASKCTIEVNGDIKEEL